MPRRLFLAPIALFLALAAGCVPAGKGEGPAPVPTAEISVSALPPAGTSYPQAVTDPADDTAPLTPAPLTDTPPAATEPAAPASGAEETVPATGTEEVAQPEEVPPEAAPPPLSPQALACQRRGGLYRSTGAGDIKACVKETGEGAKRCTRETDCKGVCLARSGTCSPVTPLFGCNEILQADGRRATLCIE